MLCSVCRTENPVRAKFCFSCGTSLPSAGQQSADNSPDSESAEPERRLVTVLFCDLVDSTPLAARLDPEDLRDVVRAYHEACVGAVERFGGYVAQYLGDGILAYFGYPIAREGDAQRAVTTGLALVDAVGKLNQTHLSRDWPAIAIRVGIDSGLVVTGQVGSGARMELLALGSTPNIAARVQAAAEPNTVLVTGATQRLVHGYFSFEALGTRDLKGLPKMVELFRVVRESTARSRLDVLAATSTTPLVARESVLDLLNRHWNEVREHGGRAILISGEAGIGKSRVARAFAERVAAEPDTSVVPLRCSPNYSSTPFQPVIDFLGQLALHFSDEDSNDHKLQRLREWLQGLDMVDSYPLFATLLSLPLSDDNHPVDLSPERQRIATMDALTQLLLRRAAERQLLLLVDDLHWADPSTVDLLGQIVRRMGDAHVLLLMTTRPERYPVSIDRASIIEVVLDRLPQWATIEMVRAIAGGRQLSPELEHQVITNSDGIPLFVEELTRLLLESPRVVDGDPRAVREPVAEAIPATLDGLLRARLDQTAGAKAVAQLGATVGRDFTRRMLTAVGVLDEDALERGLARLVDAGLLVQRAEAGEVVYTFRHALVQEAAYESLLRGTRQRYHHEIARVLQEQFPDLIASRPELLAQHLTRAGRGELAIPHWLAGARRALERSANLEAIEQLSQALHLLGSQPEEAERWQAEAPAQVMLAIALLAVHGFADTAVGEAWARARDLAGRLGTSSLLATALYGNFTFYFVRGEHAIAAALAADVDRMAEQLKIADVAVVGRLSLFWSLWISGKLGPALVQAERLFSVHEPAQSQRYAVLFGTEPRLSVQGSLAMVYWLAGQSEHARRAAHEALNAARACNHPHSVAHTLVNLLFYYTASSQPDVVLDLADEAVQLCRDQVLVFEGIMAAVLQTWARIERGNLDPEPGLMQLHQHISAYFQTGAALVRPYWLGLLAQASVRTGRLAEAHELTAQALSAATSSGERFWEAELLRLRGSLLQEQPLDGEPSMAGSQAGMLPATAEACFLAALEVANRQGAHSLHLRAATSLAQLWRQQGRASEATALVDASRASLHDGLSEPVGVGADDGGPLGPRAAAQSVL